MMTSDANRNELFRIADPRTWQEEAFDLWLECDHPEFFVEACPGAGKTRFGAMCAWWLVNGWSPEAFVVFVSPTTNIKAGFHEWPMNYGVAIHESIKSDANPGAAYNGCTVTYSQLVHLWKSGTLQRWSNLRQICCVFDEVHHIDEMDGNDSAWYDASKALHDISVHTVAMSGTPFRNIGRVPFIDSCRDEGAHYAYTYGRGLTDVGVVRPVAFCADDAKWSVRQRGEADRQGLASAIEQSDYAAINAVLDSRNDWIRKTIIKANDDLSNLRKSDPDAACLIVCRPGATGEDDRHAKMVAKVVEDVVGKEHVALVLSDKDQSTSTIEDFREGKQKFIVAVRMVSEGVDIPRLRCVVIATSCQSETMFRQIVGRGVRWEDDGPSDQKSLIYIPDFKWFAEWKSRIEDEVKQAENKPKTPRPPREITERKTVERYTSSDRGIEDVMYRHEEIPEAYVRKALAIKDRGKVNEDYITIAAILREADMSDEEPERNEAKYQYEEKKLLRSKGRKLAQRVFYMSKDKYVMDSIGFVYSKSFEKVGVDSLDDLHDNYPSSRMQRWVDILEDWVESGVEGEFECR